MGLIKKMLKMGEFRVFLYLICLVTSGILASCSEICRNPYFVKGDYVESRHISDFDFSNKVTCSMKGATIEDVVSMLPSSVSVVYDESLLDKPIFGELRNASYAEFFAVVAKNIGCELEKLGSVYVFTKKKEDGKGSAIGATSFTGSYRYFFRLSGIQRTRITELFQPYKIKYIGSSKFLFQGSVSDAVNCDLIYHEILESLPSEYVFDVYFITEDLIKDIYVLDGKTNGVLNMSYSIGNLVSRSSVDWSYVISSAYNSGLSYNRSKAVRVLSGVFTEDVPYNVTIGDSIPIVNKTVTESGAVVESGVSYQDIGIMLNVSCEGLSRGVVNISLSVTDSSGDISGYPVKHGSTLKTCFSVADDDYHFVGSFFGDIKQNRLLGVSRSVNAFYVVARVRRISSNQSVLFPLDKNEEKNKKNQEKNFE